MQMIFCCTGLFHQKMTLLPFRVMSTILKPGPLPISCPSTYQSAKSCMSHVRGPHYPPQTQLCLVHGTVLEVVSTFKYLGLLISSDMSWSNHIKDICSKARKILGLLYRRYYQYADESTLLQLYMSLVRPHLEYAAPVWDPHLQKDIQLLEDTQKFACRMCNKSWNAGYDELLDPICSNSLLLAPTHIFILLYHVRFRSGIGYLYL